MVVGEGVDGMGGGRVALMLGPLQNPKIEAASNAGKRTRGRLCLVASLLWFPVKNPLVALAQGRSLPFCGLVPPPPSSLPLSNIDSIRQRPPVGGGGVSPGA